MPVLDSWFSHYYFDECIPIAGETIQGRNLLMVLGDGTMDQNWWDDVLAHESPSPNQKLNGSRGEKSSTTPESTNSPSWIIMAPLALLSGILGGLFVNYIYIPIVHNGSTEWPDEGGFIAMMFATATLALFAYLWRGMQR